MATTQDSIELKYEESPRYEGAATTTPFGISTVARYFPTSEGKLVPSAQFIDRSDELRGHEADPFQLIDTFQPAGSLKLRAYLDDLIFLFGLAGFKGVYTAGDGVITDPDAATIPTGAGRWVYDKRGGTTAKTAQLTACYADEAVWNRVQGAGISQLDISASGDVVAALMGLVFSRLTSDPNITPSYPSAGIQPARKGDLALSWYASGGNTDDFSISFKNPLVARRSMTIASYFPDKMEHDKQRVQVTGTVPKSTLAAADVDAQVTGQVFAAKAKWIVPHVIGATAYKYTIWIDMPSCQIIGGDIDGVSNARNFGNSANFKAAFDETAGYDCRVTIVGSVTSISSVGN